MSNNCIWEGKIFFTTLNIDLIENRLKDSNTICQHLFENNNNLNYLKKGLDETFHMINLSLDNKNTSENVIINYIF